MTRRRTDTIEERRARFNKWCDFIAEMRPTCIEPFADIVSAADYAMMRAIVDLGHAMRCEDTGRLFIPARCVRG